MSSDEEVTPQGANDATVACPYLGLADDADSHATFATDAHRCFRLPNPTRIASGHQDAYCLSDNHLTCPVYLGEAVSQTRQEGRTAAGAARAGAAAAAGSAVNEEQLEDGDDELPPNGEEGLSPRPRPGGIPMPALTIGILVLAAIVLGLAIWINDLGGDDDGGLVPSDILQTQTALETLQAGTPGATTEPTGSAETSTAEPGTTTTPTIPTATATSDQGQAYTVVAGDTCTAIAEKNSISLEDLFIANDLNNESCALLAIGRELVIP